MVARELLADRGSIFVQIGEENVHSVRSLLDEVFGWQNFISQIGFQTTPYATSKFLAPVFDTLLWYGRDREQTLFEPIYLPKERLRSIASYKYSEEPSGRTRSLTATEIEQVSDPEHLFQSVSLISQGASSTPQEFEFEGRVWVPPPNSHWKTKVRGLGRAASAARIFSTENSLRFKSYLSDLPVSVIHNIWDDMITGSFTETKQFVVQTNPRVVERCILMASKPGDLVLDPTCGGGTTAFVAEKTGRRWITVDTSRVAIALSRQRLLTAKFEYYELRDREVGLSAGFQNEWFPRVSLGLIAKCEALDAISASHDSELDRLLRSCNEALAKAGDDLRQSLRLKLELKARAEGKRAVDESDRRRWCLPEIGASWEHWQVPFDTDLDWPEVLRNAVVEYRKAWQAKMAEMKACIAANARHDELVDQPKLVPNVVRVSGPFTVEGVMPGELTLAEEGLFGGAPESLVEERGEIDTKDLQLGIQNIRAYLREMLGYLGADGVRFPDNREVRFSRLVPLFDSGEAAAIHGEGRWHGAGESDADPNGRCTVAVGFGPQYGPVTALQVEDLIRAASRRGYDDLVVAGFSFDAEAVATIEEAKHPRLNVHMAHIRPDVNPGMRGLLKTTPSSQLFTVFGMPQVSVERTKDGGFVCRLEGVDIYDPVENVVRGTKAEKVAAWFLDGDYDGRTFCITQAFFPDQDAWERLAKALGGVIEPDAFEAFKGVESLPFKAGKYRRVAVKAIDPRGNEVMTVRALSSSA